MEGAAAGAAGAADVVAVLGAAAASYDDDEPGVLTSENLGSKLLPPGPTLTKPHRKVPPPAQPAPATTRAGHKALPSPHLSSRKPKPNCQTKGRRHNHNGHHHDPSPLQLTLYLYRGRDTGKLPNPKPDEDRTGDSTPNPGKKHIRALNCKSAHERA